MNNQSGIGMGGSGIIKNVLENKIPKKLLDKFQIICDSCDILDENKIRIYWSHLNPDQNEDMAKEMKINPKPLANNGWNMFHKIVFISHTQMEEWIHRYGIPRSHCTVIKYALYPIKSIKKESDEIILCYLSNPNRGLSLLVDIFDTLCKEYSNLQLNVYSSWSIYKDLDHPFLKNCGEMQSTYEKSNLYKKIQENEKINNIGFIPNEILKKQLASSHIFAYPNIMPETFCLSLLEAMSAECLCVHPNYGSLPEVSSNWTMMYDYHEDINCHKKRFYSKLKNAIDIVNLESTKKHLRKQKEYVDYFFHWDKRINEWIFLLQSLENQPFKKIKKSMYLSY